jgi:hypothetical protein
MESKILNLLRAEISLAKTLKVAEAGAVKTRVDMGRLERSDTHFQVLTSRTMAVICSNAKRPLA